jgi:hypothetical protein
VSDADLAIIVKLLRWLARRSDLGPGFLRLNAYVIIIMGLLQLKGYPLEDAEQRFDVGQLAFKRQLCARHIFAFLHRETDLPGLYIPYRRVVTRYCSWVKNLKRMYDRLSARADHQSEMDNAHMQTLRFMFEPQDPPARHSSDADTLPPITFDLLYNLSVHPLVSALDIGR